MVSISARTFRNGSLRLVWDDRSGKTVAFSYAGRDFRLYLPSSAQSDWGLCMLEGPQKARALLPRKMFFAAYLAAKREGLLDLNPQDYTP